MNIRGPFPEKRDGEGLTQHELAEKEWREDAAFKGYLLSLIFWSCTALIIVREQFGKRNIYFKY